MTFDASHLFSGVVGGLFVALVNYLGLRWRYRTDELAGYWAKTCDDIAAAADLATAYWLQDLSGDIEAAARQKNKMSEFRILGHQARLAEMQTLLETEVSKIDLLSLTPTFVDFFDALSGGDFQVDDRASDFERALLAQDVGARLVVQLRRALRRRTRLW